MQEELLDRCRNASSVGEQSRALDALAEFVNQDGTSISAKEWIARCVLLEFPYNQNVTSIALILDKCSIVIVLSSCSKILKEVSSSSSLPTKIPLTSIIQACCKTIHRIVVQPTKAIKLDDVEEKINIDHFVKMISLLPQIISNACHNMKLHQPKWAIASVFFPRLVENAVAAVGDDDEGSRSYFFALIKYMLKNLQSEFVAMGISKSHPCSTLKGLDPNPREMASLVASILKLFVDSERQDDRALETCFHLLNGSTQEHQEAFVQLNVFSKHDERMCTYIIDILERCDYLYSHLCDIAEVWSQWIFVHQTDSQQQHHVTKVLLCGLSTLKADDDDDATMADELTLALLQGVNNRLESFFQPIRIDGMQIAQAVAKRLGQELQFDELKQQQETKDKSSADVQKQTAKPIMKEGKENQMREIAKKRRVRKAKEQIDPDAEYDSDEEELSDGDFTDEDDDERSLSEDSVSWDDDLVPYDLNDPEDDLVETSKPLHLIECLDLLRTVENDDHAYSNHETALQCLPDLIRARPDNLPDIAVSLGYQLLKMENKFNITGFAEMRQNSMIALIAQEPILVGQHMINYIFEDSCLSDRLDILAALQHVAYELSGSKLLDETHEKPSLPDKSHEIPNQLSRIETKSRRKRSVRNTPRSIKNNFTPISPVWFYSLLANFIKEKENEALWSGSVGSQLLANLFRTLATTVEFTGFYGSQVLAKDLFDLVWSFRTADVAEVRLSVLISIATSLAMTPEDNFASLLLRNGNINTLPQIMNEISARDPDKSCRVLALRIVDSLNQAFGNSL